MVYKGIRIVCHYEQSIKTQRGIIYVIQTGLENSIMHDMHALPHTRTPKCLPTHVHESKRTYTLSQW